VNEGFLKTLEEKGGIMRGHFRFTSGLHADTYVQMAMALQHPDLAEALGREMAKPYKDKSVSVVVGPAMGAILVAHEVARALGVRSVFTERVEGIMVLRRGFRVSPGERVLVAEGVVTTGGTALEVVNLLNTLGAEVTGVSSIVCRGPKPSFPVPYQCLVSLDLPSYRPEECPLCRAGVPLETPGSRGLG
jgi:orotate phosphoribosyltransferase